MAEGRARSTGLVVGVALLLLTTWAPRPGQAVGHLRDLERATDPTGPLVAVLALCAWTLALWLLLTVVLVLGGRVPGLLGRAASSAARRIAPSAVRRGVELALGLAVTLGPLGAAPAAAQAPAAAATAPAATAPAATAPGDTAPVNTAQEPAPDLDWPTTDGEAAAPGPAARPPVPAPAAPTGSVVVRPGDTLWALAEASLQRTGRRAPTDRQIAAAWPVWWSANREVIGPDPDLIHPGTTLRVPSSGAAPGS